MEEFETLEELLELVESKIHEHQSYGNRVKNKKMHGAEKFYNEVKDQLNSRIRGIPFQELDNRQLCYMLLHYLQTSIERLEDNKNAGVPVNTSITDLREILSQSKNTYRNILIEICIPVNTFNKQFHL